jgi:hypothetical protein
VSPDDVAALVIIGALAYELAAVSTRRIPTISGLVWTLPVAGRFGVWLVGGAVLFDHLVTRRFA